MLKSLEVFGFKSFAEKTKFEFSTGITAVVGPNGSGKSNVVDSLKWILGDQSPKSLRGKEMTDVIFNGAANRKASGFAEATLTLDNSTRFLDIDSTEVEIGRRLWRSGDSEYLINRQTARLRDVRDLLMGTGAGASAYCIIEQGRVDQILQANASTRRTVFEEASGIGRYKTRKNEAQRKLERVDQNLLRLRDIVSEVESQLVSLRNQASRAARYRELSQQLREHWVGLAADDYRLLRHQWSQVQERSTQRHEAAKELSERQDQLQQELVSADESLSRLEVELRKTEQRQMAEREQIARDEATIRHETTRTRELHVELSRLRGERQGLAQRFRESDLEEAHLKSVVEQLEQDTALRLRQIEADESEVARKSELIEQEKRRVRSLREKLLEQLKESSVLGGEIANLEKQQQDAAQERQDLHAQLDKVRNEVGIADAEYEQALLQLAESEQELRLHQESLRALQAARDELVAEREDSQKKLAELREKWSGSQARLHVLEDLESRQEGMGVGVREILERAGSSPYRPWTEVLGSVADLLEVELDHAAIVEVALGSRSQLVVVEQLEPFLEYVQKGSTVISGRVGFLEAVSGRVVGAELDGHPAKTLGSRLAPAHDLTAEPGVVARADQFAKSPEIAPFLSAQLLGDTWVVETLEQAIRLLQGPGAECRFVTLQGELLEGPGTLYAGRVRHESALVSRKSELRRLRNDLLRLESRIADERIGIDNLESALAEKKLDIAAAEKAVREQSGNVERANRHCHDAERRTEQLATELDRLQNSIKSCLHGVESRAQELLDLTQRHHALEAELQTKQLECDNTDREVLDAESDVQSLHVQEASLRGVIERQREQLRESCDALEKLTRERRIQREQLSEMTVRLRDLEVRIRDSQLELLNRRGVLAERVLEEERLIEECSEWFHEAVRLRAERTQIVESEAELRAEQRSVEERWHADEISERELRHQMDSLESRIREEFQLELAGMADSDASVWRQHCAETARVLERADCDSEDCDNVEPAGFSDSVIDAIEEYAAMRPEFEDRLEQLRRKLRNLGHVNTSSLDHLDELERRFESMNSQLQDLLEAKRSLEEIIRRINTESRRLFLETFTTIRDHFRELFRKLFGGGEGDVVLEDPEDVLDCGIEIVARPPGKELRSLSLLSGGEKTLTAVALLLAIFRSRPSPFCILDEVDAALDEANVERFVQVLKEFQATTQFIMISHRKPSMAAADVLYGVTMEESGVSKRMSVRFDQINEHGEFIGDSSGSTEAA